MVRSIWSGAISFRLIYIPVKLFNASEQQELDFDMLRKGGLCRIRYARVRIEGTYTALGAKTRAESENLLAEQWAKGSLKIVLRGEKLRGAYSLSKMRGGKKANAWLLIKRQDDFATKPDVLLWDRSVLSGRSMDEIAAAREAGRVPVEPR